MLLKQQAKVKHVADLELPFCSLIITFLKNNILKNGHTCILMIASYQRICVEFKTTTTQHWFSYFQIALKF